MPERKFKVVFINQSLGRGGAETFTHGLFGWLKKRGITVKIYATNHRVYPTATTIPLVVDVIGDWKGLVKGVCLLPLAAFYYLYLVWRSRTADLILMTGYIEKILVTPWAKLLGIPVVWVEFAPLETVLTKFWGFPKLLYFLVKNLPDRVIVPTRNTQSHLLSPSIVIPCAIDASIYNSVRAQKNLVCCVSRLEAGKGQDLLIAAWPEVLRQVPQAKLRIVGEGDQYQNLKFQISNFKLHQSVVLTGWVKDARAEMAKAEVVVFPTLWPLEGFGLVAVEAMSQVKPVIGFKFGPVPEIVTDGCGILVPPANITALASAIVDLLTHPAKAEQMGQAGRKRYLTHYTFNHVGPQYLQVCTQVCARV